MNFDLEIQSRDEMITFGQSLGRILKSMVRQKPWLISLTGDEASGKELLALAIDQTFNPHHYAQGIEPHMSADKELDATKKGSVVFNNFKRPIYSTKERFDRALKEYEAKNQGTCVLIASNIERTFFDEFDYRAQGLESDVLDISLQVHKKAGTFNRHILLTAEDEVIVRNMTDYLLGLPGSAKNSSLNINKYP